MTIPLRGRFVPKIFESMVIIMSYVNLPKTKRGEQTLKRICDAAEELFLERGYYHTEVSDITKKAGVATGTFYIYFQDKVSVFLHLMDTLGRKLRREIRLAKQASPNLPFVENERVIFRVWFSFVREHMGIFHICWQSLFIEPEFFKKYYERFSAGYIDEIVKAQDAGELRELDPELLSYLLLGVYNFVALKYLILDKSGPDDELIDQLISILSTGILK